MSNPVARENILEAFALFKAARNIADHATTALAMGDREAPREKARLENAKRKADNRVFIAEENLLRAINEATL